MRNRQLKVDPGLKWTYVAVMDHDVMLLDVLVDGPFHWQTRDIANIARRYDVDQVDVDFTGVGIILAHALTEQLDIPVLPWSPAVAS